MVTEKNIQAISTPFVMLTSTGNMIVDFVTQNTILAGIKSVYSFVLINDVQYKLCQYLNIVNADDRLVCTC